MRRRLTRIAEERNPKRAPKKLPLAVAVGA